MTAGPASPAWPAPPPRASHGRTFGLPLNTRSPQKTDKAGAATDGALPKEAERSETAAEPSQGSDAGSEPATESAAPAPGSSAEPEPESEPDAASVTETEDEATTAQAPEPESGGDSATGRAAKAGTEAGTEADIAQAEAAGADTPAAGESDAAAADAGAPASAGESDAITADPDTPLADTEPGATAVDADAPASGSVDGRTAAEGDSDAAADGGTDAGRPPGARPRLRRLRDWRADPRGRPCHRRHGHRARRCARRRLAPPAKQAGLPAHGVPEDPGGGADRCRRADRAATAAAAGPGLARRDRARCTDPAQPARHRFYQYLGRGFNVILDWSLFADAYAYLKDTLGGTGALGHWRRSSCWPCSYRPSRRCPSSGSAM